ncbi:MAG: VTT domain-containing protein [Phenylobacterium sp.]
MGLIGLGVAAAAALLFAPVSKAEALEMLRTHAVGWRTYSGEHPILALSAFVAAYAVAVAAFLPVALVMTAAGGFLFGTITGALASVGGATLGGLVGYGLARGALGSTVQRRARKGGKLEKLLKSVKQDTFRVVLSLRLLPLTPFTLVSLAAGVVKARLRAFLAATALGILPECLLYAAVGHGLSSVLARGGALQASDLLRPGVVWPLVGLALLSAATIVASVRRAKAA